MKRSYSLIVSLFLPFLVAGITYVGVHSNQNLYSILLLPEHLVINQYLYALLWMIQYFLLGYASYLIYQSHNEDGKKNLILYGLQLFLLLLWPIAFFNGHNYLLAIVIILFSWGLSIIMIYTFYKINPHASYWLIPYFIWVSYMLYYHFNIFMLN